MSDDATRERPPIPGVIRPVRRLAQALARPLSAFLHVQASSGLLLLAASIAALALANSRFQPAYEHLWHVPISVGIGGATFTRPVHFWINDGLMVIFFFVVGLEIRREIHAGELSEPRRAALPAICALGGMLAPALIYLSLNPAPPTKSGWGVPMATDIAFAVGVLALLGKRVPSAIRVLLLALAIIDDIGAIVVIAVFYSSGLSWIGFGVAAVGVIGVLALKSAGVRHALAYVIPGVVLWAGFLKAGIHPTIAGVILGLLTPARAWYGVSGFVATAEDALVEVRTRAADGRDAHDFLEPLDRFAEARREALPQVVRLEAALHPWVAFGIMPLFAFANAGVRLGGADIGDPGARSIAIGVAAGLCAGKPIGVFLAALIAVKAGIATRPRGVTWRGVAVVGLVAGIGFTMAIFIASLAFAEPGALAAAKLAILGASAIAAAIALVAGRLLLPRPTAAEGPAITPEEAEASTDA